MKTIMFITKALLIFLAAFTIVSISYSNDISTYNVNFKLINTMKFDIEPLDIKINADKIYLLTPGPVLWMNVTDTRAGNTFYSYANVSGANAMAFYGKYGYFAMGTLIKVFDLSVTPPTERFSLETSSATEKMEIKEGALYTIKRNLGLYIYDLQNLETPVLRTFQMVSGNANSLFILNQTAYVTSLNATLSMINISRPTQPTTAGTYNNGMNFYDVFVKEKYAYISQGSTGVQVVDVTNPQKPVQITNIFSRKFSSQCIVTNYYAWVNDASSIQAFYSKDANSYQYAGSYDNYGAGINRIEITDAEYVYVCSDDNTLKVLQIVYNY